MGKSWMAAVALLFHAIHQPESLCIVALPGNSPDAIRGFFGVTMLVIDEAAMVSESLAYYIYLWRKSICGCSRRSEYSVLRFVGF